ncbi:MAG: LysR family transcriptional regulator [Oleiphilaceae bacterium]|nr:LysR family transcriptional regulator [Oleiphilaceae bacterium]
MNNYEAFDAVVTHGCFTKAAKQLHRSPSAISKLIAQ